MTAPTATMSANRCFGYTPAGDIDPGEAHIIRAMVTDVGLGASLSAVVESLNRQGIRTVTGRPWQLTSLVRLLTNPRLAGLTPKRRGSTQPAPAILSEAEHKQLAGQAARRRAVMLSTPRQRTTATRLLSGLLRCGRCGADMYAHVNRQGRAYRCAPPTGSGPPCGRTQIQAEPLEAHVVERTLARLGNLALPDPAAELRDKLAALESYRDGLDAAHAAGVSPVDYEQQRRRIKQRRYVLRSQLAATAPDTLALPRDGDDPQAWWDRLPVEDRQRVLSAAWQAVVISGPTRSMGTAGLDTGRVQLLPQR